MDEQTCSGMALANAPSSRKARGQPSARFHCVRFAQKTLSRFQMMNPRENMAAPAESVGDFVLSDFVEKIKTHQSKTYARRYF